MKRDSLLLTRDRGLEFRARRGGLQSLKLLTGLDHIALSPGGAIRSTSYRLELSSHPALALVPKMQPVTLLLVWLPLMSLAVSSRDASGLGSDTAC